MNITNEVYTSCPKCQTEAHGLDEIQKIFGYYIEKDDLKPYQYCRSCRKWMEEASKMKSQKRNRHYNQHQSQHKDPEWASAASWGRRMQINRSEFESRLEELHYLVSKSEDAKFRTIEITDLGKEHSAVTNNPFHKVVLWDDDTYMKVTSLRAQKVKIHYCCSKCGKRLDEQPNFEPSKGKFVCLGCRNVSYSCVIEVECEK